MQNNPEEWKRKLYYRRWYYAHPKIFKIKCEEQFSALLTLCQYISILVHNTNVDRIYSLMNNQLTKVEISWM